LRDRDVGLRHWSIRCSAPVIVVAMLRGCVVVLIALAGASAACHVVIETETLRPVATERVRHPEGAVARRPALMVTDAGQLRFVEPLECPTEELVRQRTTVEVVTRPNVATFTIGVLVAAAGGVMLTTGLFSNHPGSSAYTYLGAGALGVSVPFAIGPWIGNGTKLRERGDGEPAAVRRPGPSEPCGDRPLAARAATLDVAGIEVRGAIDRNGVFEISPYQWVDAFRAADASASAVTATVDSDAGPRTIAAVLDAATLTRHAAAFLARADFDAAVEPLRLVPGITAGAVRANLVATDRGAALRVVLPLRNDGPGDAWALRGQIAAPQLPAIDGRMIYVGKLAKGAAVARELVIPLTGSAAAALRRAPVDFSVELRDAHGTAPTTPLRFHGAIADAR
jgi:hypothetical protein